MILNSQSLDIFMTKREDPKASPRQRNRHLVEERQRWIDGALRWEGSFNRRDAASRFGISSSQVSADVAAYNQLGSGFAIYDYRQWLYVAGTRHQSVFGVELGEWMRLRQGSVPDGAEPVPNFAPAFDEKAVQALLVATRRSRPCEVTSYSEPRGGSHLAIMHPHALFQDGPHWFARCWDETRRGFTDLCLAHVLEARIAEGRQWVPAEADGSWTTMVRLPLVVNPNLPPERRFLVERETGMRDGRVVVTMRRALVGRFLARAGILDALFHGLEVAPSATIWPENPAQAAEWAAEHRRR